MQKVAATWLKNKQVDPISGYCKMLMLYMASPDDACVCLFVLSVVLSEELSIVESPRRENH